MAGHIGHPLVPSFPPPRFAAKIATPGDFAHRAAALPRPVVFTYGVFDILHRGHVTYLDQAAALGASLIVGVNSDESVRRLGKGDDRPINKLDDRMAVLAALEAVKLVIPFAQDTPLDLILACQPDILVKGGDWSVEQIIGAREVLAGGGRVLSIPFVVDQSTTALVARIRYNESR